MLRAPFSSEFDPSEEAEGSIDPLGLAPAYERLADRLLPAVTVRMGRPRFVTAMALGACVCGDWDTDAVSLDVASAGLTTVSVRSIGRPYKRRVDGRVGFSSAWSATFVDAVSGLTATREVEEPD